MARQSVFDRYEPFIAGAILAAHGNTPNNEFRQYDVRSMLEICSNWVSSGEEHSTLPVQNTQVQRYVEALIEDGFARKLEKRTHPVYRLTRTGLIELISRLVSQQHFNPREHFYFVFFFVEAYRKRIIDFVKHEGKRFPYSLQLELETLLDPEILIDRQIEHTSRELRQLDKRIQDYEEIQNLVLKCVKEGMDYAEVVAAIDKSLPFAFTAHRRFSEVFSRGTERQGLWEMTTGNAKRAINIWGPCRELLATHINELEKLKKRVQDAKSSGS